MPRTGTVPRSSTDGMPELVALPWRAHTEAVVHTSFGAMCRRMPVLVGEALRLAWRASRFDTAGVILAQAASGCATAFGLLATQQTLTALLADGPTPQRVRAALPALLVVAATMVVRGGLQIAAAWTQSRLEPQVTRLVEARLFETTTRVELASFDDPHFADDLERVRERGVAAAPEVTESALSVLTGLIGVAAVAGTLLALHPVLLPLLILAAVPRGAAAVWTARRRYASVYARATLHRHKWLLACLMAERYAAAELRAFTIREFLLHRFNRLAAANQEADLRLAGLQSRTQVLGDGLAGVGTAAVYVALGFLLTSGGIPLAAAGTAVLALQAGRAAVQTLVRAGNQLYEEGLYFRDYTDFCERASDRMPRSAIRTAPPRFGEILVKDVTFAYPGADRPAVTGVNMRIRTGEVVALVGENGSGKSTLAKLLAGLYQPTEGLIRWDDVPLADVDPESLREHVALIAQDHAKWPLTAWQNITIGRTGRGGGKAPVHAAAHAAGVHEVITSLSYGYDTFLHRWFVDGHELSGGQWQRLAAARGFYRDAPLLICDEPSAALDPRAEHQLFRQLLDHNHGRTIVLITHRLANVRRADQIYVMDQGTVVEVGDHSQLMAARGCYAELFTIQAEAYLRH